MKNNHKETVVIDLTGSDSEVEIVQDEYLDDPRNEKCSLYGEEKIKERSLSQGEWIEKGPLYSDVNLHSPVLFSSEENEQINELLPSPTRENEHKETFINSNCSYQRP